MRLETFSYLPPMSREQVGKQISYILARKLVPALEYTGRVSVEDHYWTMWKLPLFAAVKPEDVIAEIEACKAANPGCYVRLNGYDPVRQGQVVSFVVFNPGQ